MKKLLGTLAVGLCLVAASSALAVSISLNQSTPKSGYDLGGGQYALQIGVQADPTSGSLVGQTITSADLFGAIVSGSGNVLGFYYAAGNTVSGSFDNISQFSPFVSDTVSAGSNPAKNYAVWDSLYVITTGLFTSDSSATISIPSSGLTTGQNPFRSVPDGGSTLALMGFALAGFAGLRRKLAA